MCVLRVYGRTQPITFSSTIRRAAACTEARSRRRQGPFEQRLLGASRRKRGHRPETCLPRYIQSMDGECLASAPWPSIPILSAVAELFGVSMSTFRKGAAERKCDVCCFSGDAWRGGRCRCRLHPIAIPPCTLVLDQPNRAPSTLVNGGVKPQAPLFGSEATIDLSIGGLK